MLTLQMIGLILGVPLSILGILGGLVSLSQNWRQWRVAMRPHGHKGVAWVVARRDDKPDGAEVLFLVAEDLIHFIGNFAKTDLGGRIISITAVGEYYEVLMKFNPGSSLTFIVTPKD